MDLSRLDTPAVLSALGTSEAGLSAAAAAERRKEDGPNTVEGGRNHRYLWAKLAGEFTHLFAAILWVAALLAAIAEVADPGQGMGRLAVILVVIIIVSGLFSFWQEYRAERTLSALQKLLPQKVTVLRDGAAQVILAEDLVRGDIVHLEAGDKIPADCRVLAAQAAHVSLANLSGESTPVAINAAPTAGGASGERVNVVLAGTQLLAGHVRAVVYATGMATQFGAIAHLTQGQRPSDSPLRREMAHVSRVIMWTALALGAGFFGVSYLQRLPLWQAVLFSIGIVVAMVPEGLLPTLTLSLVLAAQRMAKRHVLVAHLPAVEALGAATVICTDKTGTLTQNRMEAARLALGGHLMAVGELSAAPARLAGGQRLLEAAGYCQGLMRRQEQGVTTWAGDSTELALVALAEKALGTLPSYERLSEMPFDGDHMWAATTHAFPGGPRTMVKGAPEALLPLCNKVIGEGGEEPLDASWRQILAAQQGDLTSAGLRVLAFADRAGPESKVDGGGLTLLGLIGLYDPPRPEVPKAIDKCLSAGIKVIMITGDHPGTAEAIARRIGLVRQANVRVITGQDMATLSAAALHTVLAEPALIFARVSAAHKMRIVEALRRKGEVVAVTGDGVNDAPALKAADIGVAMGLSGSDVAKEAADIVLLDDNFASIVAAIEEGRRVFANIRKFLTYVLVHNVAELVPFLAFALVRLPLGLLPVQALVVDMVSDSLTSLGLGADHADPDIMRRPPQARGERLLNKALMLRAYAFLGPLEAAMAMTAFLAVLIQGGWTYPNLPLPGDPLYQEATTACLCAIIAGQIANVCNCRSPERSVFSSGFSGAMRGNRLILVGIAFEILTMLVSVYSPVANRFLSTRPLGVESWVRITCLAVLVLVAEEGRKALKRWRTKFNVKQS